MRQGWAITDMMLTGTGIGVAALSLAFAIRTIGAGDGTPSISGNEHLLIFTRPAMRTADAALPHAPKLREEGPADPVVTGSIAPRDRAGRVPPAGIAGGYRLVQVFGDRAIVDGPNGLTIVVEGAKLADGALVLGLEESGGRWRVRTSKGLITAGK